MSLSATEVWSRICEAADTMKALQVTIGPAGFKSSWPDIVRGGWGLLDGNTGRFQTMEEPRPAPPQGRKIDEMDEALTWLDWLDKRDQRVVWSRANGSDWWKIAQIIKRSERTAIRLRDGAISLIVLRLNKKRRKIV